MHFFNRTVLASLASLLLLAVAPTHAQNSTENKHPPLDKYQWTYDTDPYGSEAIINEKLIRHSGIWIKFKRAPRINDTRNTWVELIHKIPEKSLAGISKIRLTYQCEIPLLVKLSQLDYGKKTDKGGNNIQPQYQVELPATTQWVTEEIDLIDFTLPTSTLSFTNESTTNGVSVPKIVPTSYPVVEPTEIDAIYLVPSFTDKDGGEAILQIRAIELLP